MSTKLDVISQQAFLLSHSIENASSTREVDDLRLDAQLLLVQAGSQSIVLSSFIEGLLKKAETKYIAIHVEEVRKEAVLRNVQNTAAAAPPAPGFQTTMYTLMSKDERALFDSFDPNMEYKVIKVGDQVVTEEYVSGGKIRDALSRIKYHSLPEHEKAKVPEHERPKGSKEEQMQQLQKDLDLVEGVQLGRANGERPRPIRIGASAQADAASAANTDHPIAPQPIPTHRGPKEVNMSKAEVTKVHTVFAAAHEKVDGVKEALTRIDVEMAAVDLRMPENSEAEKKMKALLKPDIEKKVIEKHGLRQESRELEKLLQEDILDDILTDTASTPEKVKEREQRAAKESALAKAPTWQDTLTSVPSTGNSNIPAGPRLPRSGPGGVSI